VTAWVPSTFDHAQTAFPLTGAHAAQACESCHIGGNYNIVYTDCWQCHETDYNAALNPNHVSAQFAHDCTTCHDLNAWKPATFDHAATSFPLQGAHAAQACESCHIGGNYNIVYTDCWQCHETDFQATVNPAHATNLFPHDCRTCHNESAWTPSTFDHASTAFPLSGAHQTRPCLDCHTGGNYALTYSDCYQCHQSDYQSAANPGHASNQFSFDCTACHTTTSWRPSTFNHATTNFPITGAHTSATCLDCHVGGNYTLVYTDCYQCHQSDYTSATLPANHAALNLNHNCAVCHTQSSWDPATLFRTSHNVNAPSGFPIYGSVKHKYQDEWDRCDECHTTNVTATFCCTSCHEHSNKNEMDNEHNGVSGYSYNCTSCAGSGCHPNGREP
jgi:nitrate/TMAO reductase-like tetraheme cytochrome c subunit